jgi:predicted MPP superfamily phosphohydrolase
MLVTVIVLGTLGLQGAAAGAAPGPEAPQVVRHTVRWPGLERSVRVAHLSDLHLGRFTPRARIEAAILAVREARPDLTVLTGDYLNRSLQHARELETRLARLPRPCLAVLGNHDHWSGASGVERALLRAGALVLSNRSQRVRGQGFELTVVGIDDAYTAHHRIRAAFSGLARPRDALVLTHHPGIATAIARLGGRLILTGHTHGERAVHGRFLQGFYELENARLYVNPGLGTGRAAPRRVAPEVAIFELTPSAGNKH